MKMKGDNKMKKATAVLMAVSLFACSSNSGASGASPASPPASSPAPSSPSAAAVPPESPSASAPASSSPEKAGYITDKFDHFSRKAFKIAYVCSTLEQPFTKAISDDLEKLGKVLNYEYLVYNGSGDDFINQITVLADQGYQGIVISSSNEIVKRAYEVCMELKVAFTAESTGFRDDSGKCIWPCVEQDQIANGSQCVQWLADNYKNYWKDPIDDAKLGLIPITYSVVSSINDRVPGMVDTFKKLFPKSAGNIYIADLITVTSGVPTQQNAVDVVTPILVSHPEVEKWFITSTIDPWAQGATRGIESLNMQDKVLIDTVQADAFIDEMSSGYNGNVFVAACAISAKDFAENLAAYLVTVLEGRATPETIWPEWVAQGDKYPCVKVQGTMITRDTYKDFIASQAIS